MNKPWSQTGYFGLSQKQNGKKKNKKNMFSEMKRALDKESDKFSLKDCSVKKMN